VYVWIDFIENTSNFWETRKRWQEQLQVEKANQKKRSQRKKTQGRENQEKAKAVESNNQGVVEEETKETSHESMCLKRVDSPSVNEEFRWKKAISL